MIEDTDNELVSKHNMNIGSYIKQEQDDVEESSTGYKGNCLNIKEAAEISSYKVGHVSEYSLQEKNGVGFENNHRGCDLKQEAVECDFKQNDAKEVDGYVKENREEVELDDSKEFKINILKQDLSNDILNSEEVINSSSSNISFKSKHSPRKNIRCKIEDISWYQCSVCNYISKYKYEIRMHFKQKHNENPEVYQCEFCEHKYKSKNSLQKHIHYKHNENIDLYQCKVCNYKTKYKQHLIVHFKQKHNENPEIYQCEFCECKCKSKDYLRAHIRFKHNENIKWYQCNSCDFKTKYKQDLVSHFERKHDENPEMHHCQFCGRKFKHKGPLKMHIYWKHDKIIK